MRTLLTPFETFSACQLLWSDKSKIVIQTYESKELDDAIQLSIKEGGEFERVGESVDDYLFLKENKTHLYINDCGRITLYRK